MKKILFFTLFLCFAATPARALDAQSAQSFAETLANDIMRDVVKSKAARAQKRDAFRKIFTDAINIGSSARFTLGRFAKTASPDDVKAYTDALVDNIIFTWTERFSNYAGETIKFSGARKSEKGNDFYVTSEIEIPNGENAIEIIWRVTNKKGEIKLADLVVEGVSMLMSYRNEYTAVLQQNGGNVADLAAQLRAKNESLKNPSKKSDAKD